MPHEIGFVQNAGVLAHYMMLDKIKTFAEANGYTVLRYDTASVQRELILMAPGYSGTEQIYMGFKTYHDVGADYYNLTAASFVGYVAGNTFSAQPGAILCGIPAHNNRIDYWLTLNPQRIAFAMKVGTPVYESGYSGKFHKYAFNGQYPYPVFCGGMLSGEEAVRFSNTSHSMPYKGARAGARMRMNTGVWLQPECYPWSNSSLTGGTTQLRDTDGRQILMPIVLGDQNGDYGELDGIFYISGFGNAVENTLIIDGLTYVVIQDVSRTGFTDYYALRMDE